MKNKRGFTLVELLAVIAILAILVIIALPNVINMYNNARKNSFLTEAKSVFKESANKYMSGSLGEANSSTHIYCRSNTDSLNPLDLSGRKINYYIRTDRSGNANTVVVWDDTRYVARKGTKLEATALDDALDVTDEIKNATCDNILAKVKLAIEIKPEYKVTSSVLYRDSTHLSVKMSMEGLTDSDINSVKYVVYRKAKGDTDFVKVHQQTLTNKSDKFYYKYIDTAQVNDSNDAYYKVIAYTDDDQKIDEIETSFHYCFVAGTKVKMENGFKNIEDIKVGDMVYSYNLDNNMTELKKVTDVIKSNTIDTYVVTIGKNSVEMSPKHQVYVIDKGWVRAYDLKVGDEMFDINGEKVSINNIEYKRYSTPIDTYNLTIEGNSNYFITNTQVLVHNARPSIIYDED